MRTPSLNKTLETGVLYTAIVDNADVEGRTVDVSISSLGGLKLTRVRLALGIHSSLVGLRTRWVPSVGTEVLVLRGKNEPFVVGTLASTSGQNHDRGDQVTVKGDKVRRRDLSTFKLDDDRVSGDGAGAEDMLEGEWSIQSVLGAGIDLLTGLAMLKGGDLARVEVCAINDMVRLVSDRFSHMSAFGDHTIYRDGNRLNVRWHGTSYEHEAWGCTAKDEPKVEISEAEGATPADVDSSEKQSPEDAGRWRFSCYLGHLGDFLNLFYHDPARTLGTMATKTIDPFVSGKARFNIGPQGEILAQSVDSIVFERVNRILVPVENRKDDDPAGDKGPDWETMTKDPLKVWDYKGQDMSHACYQLRNQARWLANYHNMARFWQSSVDGKDWVMPASEADVQEPTTDAGEEDRSSLRNVRFIETYSTFRIMTDGSIVLWDGCGSAVLLSRGDIRLHASKNLYLGAAGCVTVEAGQDINLQARRNVEIVADKGGFTLAARAWLSAFCEKGTLWLRSDAAPDDNGAVADDNAEENPPSRVHNKMGVLIEAGRARLGVRAKDAVHMQVNQGDETKDDSGFRLNVAQGGVKVDAQQGNILLRARAGTAAISAAKSFVVKAIGTFFDSSFIGLGRNAVVRNNVLEVPRVVANLVSGQSLMSADGRVAEIPDPDGTESFVPKALGAREQDEFILSWDDVPLVAGPAAAHASSPALPPGYKPAGAGRPGFAPAAQHAPDDDLYESLAIQFIKAADEDVGAKYAEYSTAGALEMADTDIAKYPAPGRASPKHWVASGGARLDKPGAVVKENGATPLQLQPRQLKYIKTAHLGKPVIPRTR